MKAPFSSLHVSYSVNPVRKSLSVPFVSKPFHFGTGMLDPVWRLAETADDFVRFRENRLPEKKSLFKVFRTARKLYIGFYFEEPPETRSRQPENAASVWSGGDFAELHFGSPGPDPWLIQLAVGLSGVRFDSTGQYRLWDCAVFENADGWGAEIGLPLSRFRPVEGGICFNLCREYLKRRERSVWSPLFVQYHEVENFGELLFGSYSRIASLRTNKPQKKHLSRAEFEHLRNRWEIPATRVIHGPYLSFPEKSGMCITCRTAGRVPGIVEYRISGSRGKFRRAYSAKKGGILLSETLHSVQLKNLRPGTEYEYRFLSLAPVTEQLQDTGIRRTFRTEPSVENGFSFLVFSDIHSNAGFLRRLLTSREAGEASFHVALGDHLSRGAGQECLFAGLLDPVTEAGTARKRDIPLVFVRGNHEELGTAAAEYFHLMLHPSGKTYFTFEYGGVFFIVPDSGDDKEDSPERPKFFNRDMFREEKRFLQKTVLTDAYCKARFRVVLMHIPPFARYRSLRDMFRPLEEAALKPDLMICGHEHRFARIGGEPVNPESLWASELAELPFPVLLNACHTAVRVRAEKRRLAADTLEEENGSGKFRIQDCFSIPAKDASGEA